MALVISINSGRCDKTETRQKHNLIEFFYVKFLIMFPSLCTSFNSCCSFFRWTRAIKGVSFEKHRVKSCVPSLLNPKQSDSSIQKALETLLLFGLKCKSWTCAEHAKTTTAMSYHPTQSTSWIMQLFLIIVANVMVGVNKFPQTSWTNSDLNRLLKELSYECNGSESSERKEKTHHAWIEFRVSSLPLQARSCLSIFCPKLHPRNPGENIHFHLFLSSARLWGGRSLIPSVWLCGYSGGMCWLWHDIFIFIHSFAAPHH